MYKHKIRVLHFSFLYCRVEKRRNDCELSRGLLFYKYTTNRRSRKFCERAFSFWERDRYQRSNSCLRKKESTERFLERLKQRMPIWKKWKRDPRRFKGIYYKIDEVEEHAFKKLFVRKTAKRIGVIELRR